jgi:hypothetical protein
MGLMNQIPTGSLDVKSKCIEGWASFTPNRYMIWQVIVIEKMV